MEYRAALFCHVFNGRFQTVKSEVKSKENGTKFELTGSSSYRGCTICIIFMKGNA